MRYFYICASVAILTAAVAVRVHAQGNCQQGNCDNKVSNAVENVVEPVDATFMCNCEDKKCPELEECAAEYTVRARNQCLQRPGGLDAGFCCTTELGPFTQIFAGSCQCVKVKPKPKPKPENFEKYECNCIQTAVFKRFGPQTQLFGTRKCDQGT